MRPENITTEHLNYLDSLRESAATNMVAAAPYLANEFGLTKAEARKILSYWMKNFGKDNR